MGKVSGTLLAGLVLMAIGVGGLVVSGITGWTQTDEGWPGGWGWWGWPHGPMMPGFGRHHMFGPWSAPGPGRGALPPVAGARTVDVVATDFAFNPAEVRIRAGEVVNLRLVNQGVTAHDLVVPSQGIWLVAPTGRTAVSGFRSDVPGEYEFFCSVPGHREAGMVGRIVVTP
ncbi:MAG: cupredoxin domain-containing protein [Armatimonadota bacterium]|nr:cupredoxin domain-containing protein [Armatimonadota bacterium]MDR7518617.1 cupredoxin domain-containing protein [Armatimonadota bacterium]MDR7548484.1 cupredoxin domain-containing protein [Armatimonadota bacterium]